MERETIQGPYEWMNGSLDERIDKSIMIPVYMTKVNSEWMNRKWIY